MGPTDPHQISTTPDETFVQSRESERQVVSRTNPSVSRSHLTHLQTHRFPTDLMGGHNDSNIEKHTIPYVLFTP